MDLKGMKLSAKPTSRCYIVWNCICITSQNNKIIEMNEGFIVFRIKKMKWMW